MKLPLFAACFGILAACSSIDKPTASEAAGGVGAGGGGFSSSGGDGGPTTNDSGVADCTDLVNIGSLVDLNSVQGNPSTGTGGTLVDGTYALVTDEIYVGASGTPGPLGSSVKETIRLSKGGTAMERVVTTLDTSNKSTESRLVYAMGVTSINLVLTNTCPQTGQTEGTSFTTDGTNLVITNGTSNERRTYILK